MFLQTADNWIIAQFQRGYDYLLDRFGVLLGDAMNGAILPLVVTLALDFVDSQWLLCAVMAFIIIGNTAIANQTRREQTSGREQAHNAWAFTQRTLMLGPFRLFLVFLFLMDTVSVHFSGITANSGFTLTAYLSCVTMRKRNDSRFKRHKLASNPT